VERVIAIGSAADRSLRMIPGASIDADRWQADQQTTIDR
jgi:hypothetical protein